MLTNNEWIVLHQAALCPPVWFWYHPEFEKDEVEALQNYGFLTLNRKTHEMKITDEGLTYHEMAIRKGLHT